MMAAKKKNVSKCILCIMSVKWHKTASSRGVCGVRAAAVPGGREGRDAAIAVRTPKLYMYYA